MRPVLRFLKKIWIFSFVRRIYIATKFYNFRYWQILKWGFKSREFTNFTYQLTPKNISYLAYTISVITDKSYEGILTYIKEAEEDVELKATINETRKNSAQRIYADKNIYFGRRVGWYAFVRITKPKVVVETGVDKGLGAALICAALLRNKEEGYEGKYYGTDINPEAGYLLSGKYREMGQMLYGDSIESLSKMTEGIDLFINDSDHSADYEYREYQTVKSLIADDAIILGDNAHNTDKLAVFSKETNRDYLFFREEPLEHWYPGAGIGISFRKSTFLKNA